MLKKGFLFFLALASAGLVGCEDPADLFSSDDCDDFSQAELLELINDARAVGRTCGEVSYTRTTALVWNDKLASAAQSHANDMAGNDFLAHTGSNGLSVGDRATNAGYIWTRIGENIAAGMDADEAMDGWKASTDHCANIMDSNYQDFAMACAEDSDSRYGIYWVQVFGKQ